MTRRLPPHEMRRLEMVAAADRVRLRRLIEARLGGQPLQYLEGTAPFGPLDLVVDERVLVPRPETEQLWELVTRIADGPSVVVDLCTGSGALALGCKTTWPQARVVATDLSPDAAEVARLNATRLGLEIEVVVGDLFEPLDPDLRGSVDVVVSNPPYVTEQEWDDLPVDVKREPRMALVSGPDGTEILDRIAAEAPSWLRPGGVIACEMGETHGEHAAEVFGRHLGEVEVRRDLTGRDRFVVARRVL